MQVLEKNRSLAWFPAHGNHTGVFLFGMRNISGITYSWVSSWCGWFQLFFQYARQCVSAYTALLLRNQRRDLSPPIQAASPHSTTTPFHYDPRSCRMRPNTEIMNRARRWKKPNPGQDCCVECHEGWCTVVAQFGSGVAFITCSGRMSFHDVMVSRCVIRFQLYLVVLHVHTKTLCH